MNVTLWFSIPDRADLQVGKGDTLDFSTELFRVQKVSTHIIPVTENLRCKPEDIFTYTRVVIGDVVESGDTIALRKTFMSTKKVVSPCEGIVTGISHVKGEIEVTLDSPQEMRVLSPYRGIVDEINNQLHTFSVTFHDTRQVQLISATGDGGGPLVHILENGLPSQEEIKDCIISAPTVSSIESAKMSALGVRGFLTSGECSVWGVLCAIIKNKSEIAAIRESGKSFVAISQRDLLAAIY